jgi:hypothetical protein
MVKSSNKKAEDSVVVTEGADVALAPKVSQTETKEKVSKKTETPKTKFKIIDY